MKVLFSDRLSAAAVADDEITDPIITTFFPITIKKMDTQVRSQLMGNLLLCRTAFRCMVHSTIVMVKILDLDVHDAKFERRGKVST